MLEKLQQNSAISKFKKERPYVNAIILILAIIMLWRGVWGMLDVFLFPGSPLLSYLASFALGAVILYLDGFSLDDLKR